VGLYEAPKKPESAIDFIKEYLGASVSSDTDSLKSKIEEHHKLLQQKDKELKERDDEIWNLKAKLRKRDNQIVSFKIVA